MLASCISINVVFLVTGGVELNLCWVRLGRMGERDERKIKAPTMIMILCLSFNGIESE